MVITSKESIDKMSNIFEFRIFQVIEGLPDQNAPKSVDHGHVDRKMKVHGIVFKVTPVIKYVFFAHCCHQIDATLTFCTYRTIC